MLLLNLQFFALQKGVGSSKNGRDSSVPELGVKSSDERPYLQEIYL